jgi:hypothetical protein
VTNSNPEATCIASTSLKVHSVGASYTANKICPFGYIVILKQLTICFKYLSAILLYFTYRLLTVAGEDLFAIISYTDVYAY